MADDNEWYRVVHYVPKEFRLDGFGDEDDNFWVISVGDPFLYVIPSTGSGTKTNPDQGL